MTSPFALSKVTYLDIKDTCSEVKISRRQLAYWVDEGLLVPELGKEVKKYTVNDLRRLKVLCYLIVDQKLPLSFVRQLVDGGVMASLKFIEQMIESGALLASSSKKLSGSVLDFDSHRITPKKKLAEEALHEFGVLADESELEARLLLIGFLLFRAVFAKYRTPNSFAERRDEILSRLKSYALIARIDWNFNDEGNLYPVLALAKGDFENNLDSDELWAWIRGKPRMLEGFRKKAEELQSRRVSIPKEHLDRFWDAWTLELVKEIPESSMDDVPF